MVKSGQAVTALLTTAHPTTGAATDADSLPTATLYVNGTADAATVTVTKVATGTYKAAVTLPTLAAGDCVSIRAAATVNSVAGAGVVWSAVADTKRTSDLNDHDGTGVTLAAGHGLALDATVMKSSEFVAPLDATATTAASASALATYGSPTKAEMDAARDAVIAALPVTTAGTRIDQATRLDSNGNIVDAPLGTALGVATAGSSITAYLASDAAYATPIKTTTAATDGTWALYLSPANYTLVVALDGYYDASEGDSVITRSVIVT